MSGFSATGSLLSGSIQRPDTISLFHSEQSPGSRSWRIAENECRFNALGKYLIISTITGLARVLLGIVHTIIHLACSIFTNREHHLHEASLGAKNIGRGLIEAVPIAGNIAISIVDNVRNSRFSDMIQEAYKKNEESYYNHTTLFVYGIEVAKRLNSEVEKEIQAFVLKVGRDPSLSEYEKIIKKEPLE